MRFFVVVIGLLAGLHEFPTAPDVGDGPSDAAMHQTPHTLLTTLLSTAPQPYTRPRTAGRAAPRPPAGDGVRIADIRPAGDVLHVFSHIRKTYRVQWVLLEGGGPDVPPLAPQLLQQPAPPPAAAQKKGRKRTDAPAASPPAPVAAMWVPMADVPAAK